MNHVSLRDLASLTYNQKPHALARLWEGQYQSSNPLDVVDRWNALAEPRARRGLFWCGILMSSMLLFSLVGVVDALLHPGEGISALTLMILVPVLVGMGMFSKYRDSTPRERELERAGNLFIADLNRFLSMWGAPLHDVAHLSENQLKAFVTSALVNSAVSVRRIEVPGWQINPEKNIAHGQQLKILQENYDFLKDAFGLVPSGGYGPYFKAADKLLAGDGSAGEVPTEGYAYTG